MKATYRIVPVFLVAIGCSAGVLFAQQIRSQPLESPPTASASSDPTAEADYLALLARAKENPETTDFAKLRLAFTKTAAYQPYGRYGREDEVINDAIHSGDWTRAQELTDRLLEKNYVRIRSHLLAFILYEARTDSSRARYHRAFVDGLFRSIMKSGDGRTMETAFVVISTEEEYDVIGLSGWEFGSQGLHSESGKNFDVMTVKTKGGNPQQVYFDITLQWSKSPFGQLAPTIK